MSAGADVCTQYATVYCKAPYIRRDDAQHILSASEMCWYVVWRGYLLSCCVPAEVNWGTKVSFFMICPFCRGNRHS